MLVRLFSLIFCFAHLPTANAATVTIEGNGSAGVGNCYPFGGMGYLSPPNPYMGFVYQNVPAFSLVAGDTVAFDLGAENDNTIVVDIAMASATSNGSDQEDTSGFTTIVTAGTPADPDGNTTIGDFELVFTADAAFSFAGGGLLIRIKGVGSFANDTSCDQVLVHWGSSDSSGYFVERFYGDTDGTYPWTKTGSTYIGGFEVVTNPDVDNDGYDSIASGGTDCDDNDSSINPGATEYCDGVDNNCDGDVDEDSSADASTWYADTDSDGYGDANSTDVDCYQPTGYVSDDSDCDDTESTTYPGADEYCDGHDDDCDGDTDEDDALDVQTWYADVDSDGDGDATQTDIDCYQPSGYVENANDCDDTNAVLNTSDADSDGYTSCDSDCDDTDGAINVDATEIWYDGVDQNCDGWSDYDQDADGFDHLDYGGDDCDDENADINVDASEIWYDGVDQDCDTLSDYDADYDGQDSESYGGEDCDDADPDTYTGAPDIPYDGIITDCANADDYDADGDGDASIDYGGTDCDDANSDVYPGAEEIWYDGIDQDCDGNDDDQDEDGWSVDGDCDDEDASSYPENGVLDADCNLIEEGDTGGEGGTDKAGGCFSSNTGGKPVGAWAMLLAGLLLVRRRSA